MLVDRNAPIHAQQNQEHIVLQDLLILLVLPVQTSFGVQVPRQAKKSVLPKEDGTVQLELPGHQEYSVLLVTFVQEGLWAWHLAKLLQGGIVLWPHCLVRECRVQLGIHALVPIIT